MRTLKYSYASLEQFKIKLKNLTETFMNTWQQKKSLLHSLKAQINARQFVDIITSLILYTVFYFLSVLAIMQNSTLPL